MQTSEAVLTRRIEKTEKADASITFRAPKSLKARIKAESKRTGHSKSKILVTLIRWGLEELDKDREKGDAPESVN